MAVVLIYNLMSLNYWPFTRKITVPVMCALDYITSLRYFTAFITTLPGHSPTHPCGRNCSGTSFHTSWRNEGMLPGHRKYNIDVQDVPFCKAHNRPRTRFSTLARQAGTRGCVTAPGSLRGPIRHCHPRLLLGTGTRRMSRHPLPALVGRTLHPQHNSKD